MRFLVVDESVTMRRIIVNSLLRIGYADCVEAVDGPDGVDKVDASVDFIITSWNMLQMPGIAFARAVRARLEGRRVPLLVVTNRSVKVDEAAASEAGVSSHVVKPFTPHELKGKIDEILATQGHPA